MQVFWPKRTGEVMAKNDLRRVRTIRLEFTADDRKKPVRANLSAVAASGEQLWLGTDEGMLLDRLTASGDDRFAGHASFDLKDLLSLPDTSGKKDEIDIEGLCVADDRLWLVGSHAVTRGKADLEEDQPGDAIKALAELTSGANRRTLACFKLNEQDQTSELGKAAQLPATLKTNVLCELLAEDDHLKPFLRLPAKENGFDIEGLAVIDDRVFLGLRGPVLRGWAVLIELKVKRKKGELKLKANGPDDRRYRKHFLDLQGCGLRDLCLDTDDQPSLLLLAGPTMALDGTVRVHRWPLPGTTETDTITGSEGCPVLMEIPHKQGEDRAEGIALIGEGQHELLVVYDSPAEARCSSDDVSVDADLFALPD
jgi:hypothetical protein